MNFSAWSIRNPIAPILAFAILLVLGWSSFNAMPITRFPYIDVPLVAVSVAQSGAAPAELEAQVTKEIEDAVAGITGVKNIISTVTDGVSTTAVEFRMEVPTDKAVQDVKDAIDQIRRRPARRDRGAHRHPDRRRRPGDHDLRGLLARHDDRGAAAGSSTTSRAPCRAGRRGPRRPLRRRDREIRIELDPVKLDSFGITAAQVSQQVRATNANIGSGRAEIGTGEQAIRVLGDAAAVEAGRDDHRAALGPVRQVCDLGEVNRHLRGLRSFSRFDGEQVVFSVFRAKGASEVSVAEMVNAESTRSRTAHPDVSITLVDDTVFYT